jgi:indole-3-acetate monooxygenase
MMMTAPDAATPLLHTVSTLEPVIRHHAAAAERQRQLAHPVVRALTDARLFRICVPRALGGLKVTPLTFYQVVEAVARLDGATGWCTSIVCRWPPWYRLVVLINNTTGLRAAALPI